MKIKVTRELSIEELRQIKVIIQERVKSRDEYLDFNLWYFNHHPFLGTFWTMITLPTEIVYKLKNVRDEKRIQKIDALEKLKQPTNIKSKCKCRI